MANTFDKQELLNQPDNKFRSKSSLTVDDFIKEPKLKQFYLNEIEPLLDNYKEGRTEMKPDVIQQTKELREKRIKSQQNQMEHSGTGVKVKLENGTIKELNTIEIINMLDAHKKEIIRLNAIIDNFKNIDTIKQECI